ncbi:MAG: class B sortase [Clostridia bacterium]|nr:class B sortase [Clostridia bacterium]
MNLFRAHESFDNNGAQPSLSEDIVLTPEDGAEDTFTESLHNLLPEDIELKKTPKSKKKKSGGAVARRFVLIICIIIFVACAVYLVWNLTDKARGKAMYDEVADQFGDIFTEDAEDNGAVSRLQSLKASQRILCLKDRLDAADNPEAGYDSDSRIDEMRAKLTSLAESFPDLYGWISIGGTAINYPVVQGPDNDYYLNASPYKKPLVNGSIFVDYRNEKEIMRNFNTVLYGHNLTGGGMFHDVQTLYENEEQFMTSLIYIYTMDGAYVYEPFAVYEARADYQYFRTEFATTDQFVEFANEMQTNTRYKKDMEFVATDRIITLSTCTNRSVDGRYALQAKLVQVIH